MRTTLVALVALVVLAAAGPGVAGRAEPDADNTATRVAVEADGDARWTVVIRTRLRNDSEVRAYRAFQDRFRDNTSRYLDPFRQRMRGVVAGAAEETGRPMRAVNFSASTSVQEVPRRWGVVSYSFTWTNFARADGDALIVGDVFAGGFYLARNDTLTVSGPPAYATADAAPEPDGRADGVVTWEGRQDFADGQPRVRFAPAGEGRGVPGETLGLLAGGVVVLLAAAGGWYWLSRRPGAGGWPLGGGTDGAAGAVMTDPDRVERTLAANGGRLKQSELADELDWSASKTSRVLSDMADAGRVEKLRIGRENVVSLTDDEG